MAISCLIVFFSPSPKKGKNKDENLPIQCVMMAIVFKGTNSMYLFVMASSNLCIFLSFFPLFKLNNFITVKFQDQKEKGYLPWTKNLKNICP